ncbi:hypothetical protein [Robertmurraya sp.]|jgi:hypothetical protein|uniref:hypothetical protein n=1 Tax=Robertmurraya sp. TaxID=2837525 RepID=UPI0037045116
MYLEIANITIPALWVAVVAALFIASAIYRFFSREKVGDWYWNGFFLYFLIWKLSYIVFHLDMFIDLPLSILYFNGGTKGHLLALLLLITYFFFISKRNHALIETSIHTLLLFFLTYEVVIHLLEKNWVESLGHLFVSTIYSTLLFFLLKNNRIISRLIVILIILLELLILSIFTTIFTIEAFTLIIMGLTVLVLSNKRQGGRNT